MEFKDYYAILGVERDAPQDEIKRAYRKLARKYHPDVSQESDAETRFKELGEAYEVLKDPEKRAAYDQLGQRSAHEDFQAPPDWDAGFEFSGGGYTQEDAAAFSDFFESLFGQRRGGARHSGSGAHGAAGFGGGFEGGGYGGGFGDPRRSHAQRGEDHHAKVTIDLEDAYHGATRAITLQSAAFDAQGRLEPHRRTLNVKIPKGVKQGQRIRLSGQGSPGFEGGEAGDLFLEIEFSAHDRYRVEGRDVTLTLPVAPWEAALGASVTVPTPDRKLELKVPAGSQGGKRLRLKGRGIPGEPAGDFYVVLEIAVPPANDEATQAAYRELARVTDFDPRSGWGD